MFFCAYQSPMTTLMHLTRVCAYSLSLPFISSMTFLSVLTPTLLGNKTVDWIYTFWSNVMNYSQCHSWCAQVWIRQKWFVCVCSGIDQTSCIELWSPEEGCSHTEHPESCTASHPTIISCRRTRACRAFRMPCKIDTSEVLSRVNTRSIKTMNSIQRHF